MSVVQHKMSCCHAENISRGTQNVNLGKKNVLTATQNVLTATQNVLLGLQNVNRGTQNVRVQHKVSFERFGMSFIVRLGPSSLWGRSTIDRNDVL
jgi:hypothetical protein